MRRFSISGFALLYVVLIVSATGARSSEWVVREFGTLAHPSSGQHSLGVEKLDTSDTRLSQTKIFETGFVIESPLEGLAALTHSESYIPLPPFVHRTTWSGQAFASRAPPSLA